MSTKVNHFDVVWHLGRGDASEKMPQHIGIIDVLRGEGRKCQNGIKVVKMASKNSVLTPAPKHGLKTAPII